MSFVSFVSFVVNHHHSLRRLRLDPRPFTRDRQPPQLLPCGRSGRSS